VQGRHACEQLPTPVEGARRDQLEVQIGPVREDGLEAGLAGDHGALRKFDQASRSSVLFSEMLPIVQIGAEPSFILRSAVTASSPTTDRILFTRAGDPVGRPVGQTCPS
jgi:hypothetical protein